MLSSINFFFFLSSSNVLKSSYEENDIYGVIVHFNPGHCLLFLLLFSMMNETNNLPNKSWSKQTLFLLLVSLTVLSVALVYQPLPENFPQPWKYRVLSFWAYVFSKLVRF